MKSLSTIDRLLELNAWLDTPGYTAELRKVRGIPQAAVAKEAGVSQGCVSKWELGQKRPTGQRALAYHRALRKILDASETA